MTDTQTTARARLCNLVAAVLGVLFCLWAAGWCIERVAGQAHDYEVVVVRDPARIPAGAKGRQVWVQQASIDGRQATRADIAAVGSWRAESPDSPLLAICEEPAADTRFSLRATTLMMVLLSHPWSGRIDVFRDGQLAESVPLTGNRASSVTRYYGWEVATAPTATLLGLLVAAFVLVRPWRGGRRLTVWLAVLAGAMHAACWLTHEIGLTSDSPGYPRSLQSCAAGYPAYFPPGYGLFVLLARGFDTLPTPSFTLVQHALIVGLAIMLHGRFREWLGESWSFLGALVGGLVFPTLFGAQAAMSESWTGILLAVPLLAAIRPEGRSGRGGALLAGIAIGWATLSRVIPLAVGAPIILLIGLFPARQRDWKWLACSVGVAGAMIAAVVVHNGLHSGRWQLSDGVGHHLYNHFVYQQKLFDESAPGGRVMHELLQGRDPRELPHWEAGPVLDKAIGYDDADRLMRMVAMEGAATVGIFEHVAFTSALTWTNLSKSAVSTMVLVDGAGGAQPDLAHPALLPGTCTAMHLQDRLSWLNETQWKRICWLFAVSLGATLLLARRRGEWLAWVFTVWAYMFWSSAVEYELPRYHVAVAPLVVMLAFGTVAVAGNALAARLRRVLPMGARDTGE